MSDDHSLVVKLSAQTSEFKASILEASESWTGFLHTIGSGENLFLSLGVAVGALTVGLFELTEKTAAVGEHLNTLSEKTGVSVEQLSLLKYAAEQSETNIDALAKGMRFLAKAMVEGKGTFDDLQISVTDTEGALRPTVDVMMDVADRFKDIQSPALASTLAMKLFGKSGVELLPFLKEGSAGIEELTGKAKELGLEWSGDSAKNSHVFEDSMKSLKAATSRLAYSLGEEMMPTFTTMVKFMVDMVIPTTKVVGGIFEAVAGMATELAAGIAAAWYGITKLTDALHITTNASDGAREMMENLHGAAGELFKKADQAFSTITKGATDSTDATKGLNEESKKTIHLTDDQILASMNKAQVDADALKALKARMEEEANFNQAAMQATANFLDAKRASKTFDDDYYAVLAAHLRLQGKSDEEITALILADKAKVSDAEKKQQLEGDKIAAAGLQNWLKTRLEYGQADSEYFLKYAESLKLQGKSDEEIQAAIAKKAIETSQGQIKANEKASAETLRIWKEWLPLAMDPMGAFRDFALGAWKSIESKLGDATAQMLVNHRSWKDSMVGVWEDMKLAFIKMLVQLGVESVAQWAVNQAIMLAHPLIQHVITVQDGAPLAPGAAGPLSAGDVGAGGLPPGAEGPLPAEGTVAAPGAAAPGIGALGMVGGAVASGVTVEAANLAAKGGTKNTVEAVVLSPIGAQVGVAKELISGLTGGHSRSTSEQYWQTVRDAMINLSNDPGARALTAAKGFGGTKAYSDAITSFISHNLQYVANLKHDNEWADVKKEWIDYMASLGFPHPDPSDPSIAMLATGGIVSKPILAMMGEGSEPEVVAPLSKLKAMLGDLGGFGGGGENTFHFSLPNVRDIRDLSDSDIEQFFKRAQRSLENLNRRGWRSPLQPRTA